MILREFNELENLGGTKNYGGTQLLYWTKVLVILSFALVDSTTFLVGAVRLYELFEEKKDRKVKRKKEKEEKEKEKQRKLDKETRKGKERDVKVKKTMILGTQFRPKSYLYGIPLEVNGINSENLLRN